MVCKFHLLQLQHVNALVLRVAKWADQISELKDQAIFA